MTSLPLWVKRRCAKSENLPMQKVINNVVLNFTEFKKNTLVFINFADF